LPGVGPGGTRQRVFIFFLKKICRVSLVRGKGFFAGSQTKLPANYFIYFLFFGYIFFCALDTVNNFIFQILAQF
jgi:hypothetical protein